MRLPDSGRIPLLDSHNRASISGVLGSARNFQKNGNTLEAEVAFAETEGGRNAAVNVKDGHLTDFSVGYYPVEAVYLESGERREIGGRTLQGPMKVTTQWQLRELSVTAIGADRAATARSLDGWDADGQSGRADGPAREDRTPPAPNPPEAASGNATPALESNGLAQQAPSESGTRSGGKKPASLIDVFFYLVAAFMVLALIRGLF